MRNSVFVLLLLMAAPAGAETVYKYRNADGTVTYSNRLQRGAELIETFEYRFPAARAPSREVASKAEVQVDNRMKAHLEALDKAWASVQRATRALEAAEARLAAGDAPVEGENASLAAAPAPVPPAVGGAAPPAAPAAGGPIVAVRGGRRNPEYFQRQAVLEANVVLARERLDAALKAYNQLR